MDNKIELALQIAQDEFKNKFDKGGSPYINHLIRVALNCETKEQKIVALLHDLIEDTDYRFSKLYDLFSNDIVYAVALLTKRKNQDYQEYLNLISENELARYVKIKDLEDNMNISRLKEIEEKDLIRLLKYHKAHRFLNK